MSEQAYSTLPPIVVLKPVDWVSSAREDLRGMPENVQHDFGYAIYQAQIGKYHPDAKVLKGEFRGLIEIVANCGGTTFRAIYTVKLAGVVYVLHVFQKKATHGIGPPKHEVTTLRARLQQAKAHYARHYATTRRN
jgi:phage-related protein